jgi:cold shock CspA family protein
MQQQGIVRFYSEPRGCGFVQPSGCDEFMFFQVNPYLAFGMSEGARASFEIGPMDLTKLQAKSVKIISEGNR